MRTSSQRVASTLFALAALGAGIVEAETRDFRIHPSIGIARVGDSDEYYLAPDSWDRHFVPSEGYTAGGAVVPSAGYRDARGGIRRMGVRFRIYEYLDGEAVGEVTAAYAQIEWSVRLVNKKAAKLGPDQTQPLNPGAPGVLTIDTGPQLIGPNHPAAQREVGGCIGPAPAQAPSGDVHPFGGCVVQSPASGWVKLGDLETNAAGQLVVLGGHGVAASWDGSPLLSAADVDPPLDNPGWYDDTSDGPVSARIQLASDGSVHPVRSAWVVVAPPDYARPIENLVTLYDLARDRSARGETAVFEITRSTLRILRSKSVPGAIVRSLESIGGQEIQGEDAFLAEVERAIGRSQTEQLESLILRYAEKPLSFTLDVYPILRRVPHQQWTLLKQQAVQFGRTAMHAHGIQAGDLLLRQMLEGAHPMHRTRADFLEPAVFSLLRLDDLADPMTFLEAQRLRNHVVDRLKDPRPGGCASEGIGQPHTMPPVEGLTLTPTQYNVLLRWRDGFFVDDWQQAAGSAPIPLGPPDPGFPSNAADQPAALDRAALVGAVGGPLAPGVEVGPLMADEATYDAPFHLSGDVEAGDVTQNLSVPWQAGFNHQADLYPGARPVFVMAEVGGSYQVVAWTRPHTSRQAINTLEFSPEDATMDVDRLDFDTIHQNQRMDHNQDMVDHWMALGFLARHDDRGELMYVEVERN